MNTYSFFRNCAESLEMKLKLALSGHYPASENKSLFVVLMCYFDPDENWIDDCLCGVATTLDSAMQIAEASAHGKDYTLCMPGKPIPLASRYSTINLTFRIALTNDGALFDDSPRCIYPEQASKDTPVVTDSPAMGTIDWMKAFQNCFFLTTIPDIKMSPDTWAQMDALLMELAATKVKPSLFNRLQTLLGKLRPHS